MTYLKNNKKSKKLKGGNWKAGEYSPKSSIDWPYKNMGCFLPKKHKKHTCKTKDLYKSSSGALAYCMPEIHSYRHDGSLDKYHEIDMCYCPDLLVNPKVMKKKSGETSKQFKKRRNKLEANCKEFKHKTYDCKVNGNCQQNSTLTNNKSNNNGQPNNGTPNKNGQPNNNGTPNNNGQPNNGTPNNNGQPNNGTSNNNITPNNNGQPNNVNAKNNGHPNNVQPNNNGKTNIINEQMTNNIGNPNNGKSNNNRTNNNNTNPNINNGKPNNNGQINNNGKPNNNRQLNNNEKPNINKKANNNRNNNKNKNNSSTQNNENCSQISHSKCRSSKKCIMKYKYKSGWTNKKTKKNGRVLETKCVDDPSYNSSKNTNSSKNNNLLSVDAPNNKPSNNKPSNNIKKTKKCSEISHSECKKSDKCSMRYKYKKGWLSKTSKKQGRVLESKCVDPNDTIVKISCNLLSNKECEKSPDCNIIKTYDTFGKLKFKNLSAIWPDTNIGNIKNTHGEQTGSVCSSK
jgi:hypothetical protein